MFAANRHFLASKGKASHSQLTKMHLLSFFLCMCVGKQQTHIQLLAGQRLNQTLKCCSRVRPWPLLLPLTRCPAVMTLTNHVLLASVHINTNFALNLLLLDTAQYLFAAAITQ